MRKIKFAVGVLAAMVTFYVRPASAGYSDYAQNVSAYAGNCADMFGGGICGWTFDGPYTTYRVHNSHIWVGYGTCTCSPTQIWTTQFIGSADTSNTDSPTQAPPICGQKKAGSIVDVDSQTVAERIPIVGANFNLTYSSAWAASLTRDYKVVAPVNGTTPDDSYAVELKILGQTFDTASIPNSANQTYRYTWDGEDIGNNPVLGSVMAQIVLTPSSVGTPVPVHQAIGTLKAKLLGFGGWLPSNYHFYDKARKTLLRGDGSTRVVESFVEVGGHHLVPEADGSVVYEFGADGKHLYTRTGLIGTTIATFNYTTFSGIALLTSIAEPFSRVTTFGRNGSGVLTSITSPDGIVTSVTISGGLLTAVTNPNSQTYSMTYKTSTDLLETFTKPGSQVNTFTYDADGQLTNDSHTGGHEFALTRTQNYPDEYVTEVATSMGRTTTSTVSSYLFGTLGQFTRLTTLPSGASETYSQAGSSIRSQFQLQTSRGL